MVNSRLNTGVKRIFLGILAIMAASLLMMCSNKTNFQNSSVVPAARGFVKVTKDKNKNFLIRVELVNLAEVKRLEPTKKTYVVWMDADDNTTQNIGQMRSESGMFSSKLKADFETVSTRKPTRVFITAEDDAKAQYPGFQVVMSTKDF